MTPINPETHVLLGTQTAMPQRYSVWNRMASWPLSQKGLLLALSIQSICAIASTIGLFSTPDPPHDPILAYFVDSAIISKNCQQWTLLIASLTTGLATGLVAMHFLQKNKERTENTITPEIVAAIQNKVDLEIQKIANSRTDST